MSVAKSSFLFATGTFLSRISGLVRDRVILATFGSGVLGEAFAIAYRIPNLMREMLAEGALGSSFTKVFSELYGQDRARAQKLLVDTCVLMTLVSAVVCGLGIVFAPQIVDLMTTTRAGNEEMLRTAAGLTRILFPFLYFMILGAIMMGVLHQSGRFFITAISPIAFNVVNILGALYVSHWFAGVAPPWVDEWLADPAVTGFTLTVTLGGLAQLLMQAQGVIPDLIAGFKLWKGKPWSPDVKKVLMLMGPMVLAASAGQINVIVNTIFATGTTEGAVVWLNSAFRLLHFPIGIFGVAIGVAVLPALSRSMAKAQGQMNAQSSKEMQNAIELVLWLMVPCFIYYLVNDLEIVRCLFESGKFQLADSRESARALDAYSFALISYGLSKVMTSFYYAMERTTYALKVSLFSIASNFAVNYLLVREYGFVGLAMGFSITQALSVLLLIFGMRGHGLALDVARLLRSLATLACASIVAGAVMYALRQQMLGVSTLQELRTWLGAGIMLTSNLVVLFTVFCALGLWYLRLGPKAALAALKARRR